MLQLQEKISVHTAKNKGKWITPEVDIDKYWINSGETF